MAKRFCIPALNLFLFSSLSSPAESDELKIQSRDQSTASIAATATSPNSTLGIANHKHPNESARPLKVNLGAKEMEIGRLEGLIAEYNAVVAIYRVEEEHRQVKNSTFESIKRLATSVHEQHQVLLSQQYVLTISESDRIWKDMQTIKGVGAFFYSMISHDKTLRDYDLADGECISNHEKINEFLHGDRRVLDGSE